ncbi:hypothetical protein BKA61DRAFT_6837 [Leptodontidium sp. MPI-SDFR-AT-0119]|nr:hypothetical protein BKA61DRAFT_6837 [Leptodontidium sp. MPI-SDFR-AT-0119]
MLAVDAATRRWSSVVCLWLTILRLRSRQVRCLPTIRSNIIGNPGTWARSSVPEVQPDGTWHLVLQPFHGATNGLSICRLFFRLPGQFHFHFTCVL